MFQNKMKAVTFSYDDGVTQDIRLAELFRKYDLKATFNLNSGLLGQSGCLLREGVEVRFDKIAPADVRYIYEGHEVAGHTLTHLFLPAISEDQTINNQVEEDRIRLSDLCGYEVVGFAYPGGGKNYDHRVSELLREKTGVRYCRTIVSNASFSLQDDLYEFQPTAYHHESIDRLFTLAEDFLRSTPTEPQLFYIWGHAFEFDIHKDWDRFEEFCRMISGHNDVFYGTNREVLLSDKA